MSDLYDIRTRDAQWTEPVKGIANANRAAHDRRQLLRLLGIANDEVKACGARIAALQARLAHVRSAALFCLETSGEERDDAVRDLDLAFSDVVVAVVR